MNFNKLVKELESLLYGIEYGSIQVELTVHNKEVSKVTISKTQKNILQGVAK